MKGIFLVGGYPNFDTFESCFKAVEEKGFDFIEVSIPFSEPVADGPVIAKAIHDSIENKVNTTKILESLKKLKSKIPIYIMTYANIFYAYNLKKFSEDFKEYISGVIVPDLPNRMHSYFYENGFDIPIIPFVTPESREEDLKELKNAKADFIYFIGIRGITGGQAQLDSPEIKENIKKLKSFSNKPVVMGFGIKNYEQASQALSVANGYVVGTGAVEKQQNLDEYKTFLDNLLKKS